MVIAHAVPPAGVQGNFFLQLRHKEMASNNINNLDIVLAEYVLTYIDLCLSYLRLYSS